MSFLGKLLVVLVLFMSIVFMAAGLVVNRTYRDLQQESNELSQQVTEARQEHDELVEEQKTLDAQVQREITSVIDQLAKLEVERVALEERNSALRQELEDLQRERSRSTETVAQAQETNTQLADRVEMLREDIAQNQAARDQAFAATLAATEQLHQLQGNLEITLERNHNLRTQR